MLEHCSYWLVESKCCEYLCRRSSYFISSNFKDLKVYNLTNFDFWAPQGLYAALPEGPSRRPPSTCSSFVNMAQKIGDSQLASCIKPEAIDLRFDTFFAIVPRYENERHSSTRSSTFCDVPAEISEMLQDSTICVNF